MVFILGVEFFYYFIFYFLWLYDKNVILTYFPPFHFLFLIYFLFNNILLFISFHFINIKRIFFHFTIIKPT